jgi:hypothetical protein
MEAFCDARSGAAGEWGKDGVMRAEADVVMASRGEGLSAARIAEICHAVRRAVLGANADDPEIARAVLSGSGVLSACPHSAMNCIEWLAQSLAVTSSEARIIRDRFILAGAGRQWRLCECWRCTVLARLKREREMCIGLYIYLRHNNPKGALEQSLLELPPGHPLYVTAEGCKIDNMSGKSDTANIVDLDFVFEYSTELAVQNLMERIPESVLRSGARHEYPLHLATLRLARAISARLLEIAPDAAERAVRIFALILAHSNADGSGVAVHGDTPHLPSHPLIPSHPQLSSHPMTVVGQDAVVQLTQRPQTAKQILCSLQNTVEWVARIISDAIALYDRVAMLRRRYPVCLKTALDYVLADDLDVPPLRSLVVSYVCTPLL